MGHINETSNCLHKSQGCVYPRDQVMKSQNTWVWAARACPCTPGSPRSPYFIEKITCSLVLCQHFVAIKKHASWDWVADSVFKSTGRSSRRPRFNSKHPHKGSQNFLQLQLQGIPWPSSSFQVNQEYVWCTDRQTDKTAINIK